MVRPKIQALDPLDFSPLVKGLSESKKVQDSVEQLKQLNAAEAVLTDEQYEGYLEEFSTKLSAKLSGVKDLKERNEITNREWLKEIESGNLPEGSGPWTLTKLFQHQAQIAAQDLEPELLRVIEAAGRGVDENGDPITGDQARQMVQDVIDGGANLPAVYGTFSGAETYRQIADQMSVRAMSQINEGLMKAQKEAKFAAWGKALKRGDQTSPTPFPGFGGMFTDQDWGDEKQLNVSKYLEESSNVFDNAKHRFVRSANDWLREALDTFANDGTDDESDIMELQSFVNRIADAEVRGIALKDDDSSTTGFPQATSAIITDMQIAVARRQEQSASAAARHSQENDLAFSRTRIEVISLVRRGITDETEILTALAANAGDTGILEPLGDRPPNINFINRVRNMIGDVKLAEIRDEPSKTDVVIKDLDRLKAQGLSFDEIEAYAENAGITPTGGYGSWYEKNRGLAILDQNQENLPVLIKAKNEYTQKIPQGLFALGLADGFRQTAQEYFAEDRQAFAAALEAAPALGPADVQTVLAEAVATDEGRKSRVAALNAEIQQRVQEATSLSQQITTATSAKDLTTLTSLRESARTILSEDRVEALNNTIASIEGSARARSLPTVDTVQSQMSTILKSALLQSADGDDEQLATIEERLASASPALTSAARDIANGLLDVPTNQLAKAQSDAIAAALPSLAEQLGVVDAVDTIMKTNDPALREQMSFDRNLGESRGWLQGTKGYSEINSSGFQNENIEDYEDLQRDPKRSIAKLNQVQEQATSNILRQTTPEDRARAAVQTFSRGYLPFESVGGTMDVAQELRGSSMGTLISLGVPSSLVSVLERQPPTDPKKLAEWNERVQRLQEYTKTLGFTFETVALPADPWEGKLSRYISKFSDTTIVIRTTLDLSPAKFTDYSPLTTKFFKTSEDVDAVSDEALKKVFKIWRWPTEGPAYENRKEVFKTQQKAVNLFWSNNAR